MKCSLFIILMLYSISLFAQSDTQKVSVVKNQEGDIRELFDGKALVEMIVDCKDVAQKCPYLGIFIGRPHLEVPAHVHQDSDEILYCLSGSGRIISGDESHLITKGDTVVIPKGVKHAFKVESNEEFRAVQVFPEGGPQERFRKAKKIVKE